MASRCARLSSPKRSEKAIRLRCTRTMPTSGSVAEVLIRRASLAGSVKSRSTGISIGLSIPPSTLAAGSSCFRADSVPGPSLATERFAATSASLISTEMPPPHPITITPPPDRLWGRSSALRQACRVTSRSVNPVSSITPAWRIIACQTSCSPVIRPVCDTTARAPAEVFPPLSTSTGLSRASFFSSSKSARPSETLSI